MSTEKDKLRKDYLLILRRILQFYSERCPNKVDSHVQTRRGILFLQEFPVHAVEMTGVKLWKYKDIVLSGNFGDIHSVVTSPEGKKEAPDSQQDIADSVIENVWKTWRMVEDNDRGDFIKQVQEMLKIYTKILLLEKK